MTRWTPGGRRSSKMLEPMRSSGNGEAARFELCHSDLTAIITGPDEPGEDRWLFRHPGHRRTTIRVYPAGNRSANSRSMYHDACRVQAFTAFDVRRLAAKRHHG